MSTTKFGSGFAGALEVGDAWDADDDVTVGLDGSETYLGRDELRALRDHIIALLDTPPAT